MAVAENGNNAALVYGLIITSIGLLVAIGGLVIAYLKEKSDTGKRENIEAKREGGLVEKVDNLVTEFRKLNGTTDDTVRQLTKAEKRVQKLEDICPVWQKSTACTTGGCEDNTKEKGGT